MIDLGLHVSIRGVELAVAVFLLVALWRTVAEAMRDAWIGNGNPASHTHLAIQAVAMVAMLGFVAMLSR